MKKAKVGDLVTCVKGWEKNFDEKYLRKTTKNSKKHLPIGFLTSEGLMISGIIKGTSEIWVKEK